MKIEKMARCPYCGQQQFLNVDSDDPMNDAALEELAGEMCDCEGARTVRGMNQTQRSIDALLGDGSQERGFDYRFEDESLGNIRMICAAIQNDILDKVTLTDSGGDIVKLVKNGYCVNVMRTSKKQISM